MNSKTDRIVFIFVDGIGIGKPGPENPFSTESYPALEKLARAKLDGGAFAHPGTPAKEFDSAMGHHLRPRGDAETPVNESHASLARRIDATLGVDGLPQSGTGQATLFTGINCAELAGRHFGPYPHSKTRHTIRESNIFTRLQRTGIAANELAFSNAFPERFFEYARDKDRWTVTTRSCLDAGVSIRTIDQMRKGMALPADLSGERLSELGIPFDPITPEQAAHSMRNILNQTRFVLFEYFLTDKAGHRMDHDFARLALRRLDRFLAELIQLLNPETDLLIVTSDHGNLEDLSTRSHTVNPVPFLAHGAGANHFSHVRTIADVVGPCVALLSKV